MDVLTEDSLYCTDEQEAAIEAALIRHRAAWEHITAIADAAAKQIAQIALQAALPLENSVTKSTAVECLLDQIFMSVESVFVRQDEDTIAERAAEGRAS